MVRRLRRRQLRGCTDFACNYNEFDCDDDCILDFLMAMVCADAGGGLHRRSRGVQLQRWFRGPQCQCVNTSACNYDDCDIAFDFERHGW